MPISTDPDATQLLHDFQKGSLSSGAHVETCLARLEEGAGRINAATEILRDEARVAGRAEHEGALAGLAFSVKETIGLAHRPITAGSVRMPPLTFAQDSAVVQRVKEAGAFPIARSNVPEFAMCYDTDNLRFGRTCNPRNLDRSVGGSSGGEAALVASGACAFGIGSDIGGSIRYPAHCCGIVGFKPASEAVETTGAFPELEGSFCRSMLAIGPLTRSVRDARLVYEVMSGTRVAPFPCAQGRVLRDQHLERNIRSASVASAFQSACAHLEQICGAAEQEQMPEAEALYQAHLDLIGAEFEPAMHRLLKNAQGEEFSLMRETLGAITGRRQVSPFVFMQLWGMRLLRRSQASLDATKHMVLEQRERVRTLMGNDGFLIFPTSTELALSHGRATRSIGWPAGKRLFLPMTVMNVLDLPSISIPAPAFADSETGLLPGISLACAPGGEAALFAAASEIEKILR